MCRRVTCPNDGKPTWAGCGKHIEEALAGVPESERCTCPHETSWYTPGMYSVKKREEGEGGDSEAKETAQATGEL